MAPKKKAAEAAAPAAAAPEPTPAAGRKGGRGKTAAEDPTEPAAPTKAPKVETAAQAAGTPPAAAAGPLPKAKVDAHYRGSGEVHQEDGVNWAVNLNQTNIGQNNNKYYIIQLINNGGGKFTTHTRWGRVGEPGQNAQFGPMGLDGAKAAFVSKFKDKAANNWDAVCKDPSKFQAKPGKYTMIDVDLEDTSTVKTVVRNAQAGGAAAAAPVQNIRPSVLPPKVQDVLRIIFDKDMFKKQLAEMKIDAVKMPLGKLTKAQIERGYKALEAVDEAVKAASLNRTKLAELSSAFYTLIPHDFGRMVPPVIDTPEKVKEKFDLLNILGDIQIAVAVDAAATTGEESAENPLDVQYRELDCGLEYVPPNSDEYKFIETYTQETQGYRKCKIVNVFKVDRPFDKKRCEQFKHLGNRRLLWHGTNISVVAAILKTGLRIMPHAGGRVGKGLYFASENGKSAGYVRADNNVGFMFLNEVILGTPKEINQDDSSLTQHKVEKTFGVDSIIARGRTEPDPSKDIMIPGEWGPIAVPQGKPIPQPQWSNSTFSQSEYLVYDEGKVRVKYILQMHF